MSIEGAVLGTEAGCVASLRVATLLKSAGYFE